MNMSSTATADGGETHASCCGKSHKRKWSAVELAVMIGGFVVFWPIGLVALALKLIRGEMWPGAAESTSPWTAYKAWRDRNPGSSFSTPFSATRRTWTGPTATGNAAFDAYKTEQLARLEAERRKLDEEQRAFADYLLKLRKAKDQDEFDRFMAERNAPKPSET